jgi:signal transduction histidine kinase
MTELRVIQQKIFEIRGKKVILDFDLAETYEVETRALNQSVRRNLDRFPDDFMFQLTDEEWKTLSFTTLKGNSSQFVMSSRKNRGAKYLPLAFTEQGVAMLSSVLRSSIAIQVNISIMRTFVLIREYALTYAELAQKIAELEANYDQKFEDVYELLKQLLAHKSDKEGWEERKRIGFQ